jgi:hypothetical protein
MIVDIDSIILFIFTELDVLPQILQTIQEIAFVHGKINDLAQSVTMANLKIIELTAKETDLKRQMGLIME